jgi:hypothetical protein
MGLRVGRVLILYVCLVSPTTLLANAGRRFEVYAGAYFREQGHVVSSVGGSGDVFPMPSIALGLGYKFEITRKVNLAAEFYGTIPKSVGGGMSYVMNAGLPLVFTLVDEVELFAGLGLDMYGVSGDGGPNVQNNGTSTMTFYNADGNHVGYAPDVSLGLRLHVRPWLTVRATTYILVPLSNARRQFNTLVGLGYLF